MLAVWPSIAEGFPTVHSRVKFIQKINNCEIRTFHEIFIPMTTTKVDSIDIKGANMYRTLPCVPTAKKFRQNTNENNTENNSSLGKTDSQRLRSGYMRSFVMFAFFSFPIPHTTKSQKFLSLTVNSCCCPWLWCLFSWNLSIHLPSLGRSSFL